jgi:hypothetical protein
MRKWGALLAVLAPVTACGLPSAALPGDHPATVTVQPQATFTIQQPAPAPSQTTLGTGCEIGRLIESTTFGFNPQAIGAYFLPTDPSSSPDPSPPEGYPAYRAKLTDNLANPVSIAAISTVFYDTTGTEVTSDSRTATGIITTNQSLYWINQLPDNASAATRCDVVSWNPA